MAILMDRRPTLASWPKRIYEWAELPEKFQPALGAWRESGMPPGNVTYIPRVNQYADSPEFSTAWWQDEILLQTAHGSSVQCLRFRGADVAAVDYYVQLLRCTVTLTLSQERGGHCGTFSYNKTKEEQLLPILNLALGRAPEHSPLSQHADTPALKQLLQDSYAMYNTAKLCYRFGDALQDFLWLRGKNRGLARLNKQKPEYFVARMDRGIAWIQKDFYGTRMVTVRWEQFRQIDIQAHGKLESLCLEGNAGTLAHFPLLAGQRERAEAFLDAFPAKTAFVSPKAEGQ